LSCVCFVSSEIFVVSVVVLQVVFVGCIVLWDTDGRQLLEQFGLENILVQLFVEAVEQIASGVDLLEFLEVVLVCGHLFGGVQAVEGVLHVDLLAHDLRQLHLLGLLLPVHVQTQLLALGHLLLVPNQLQQLHLLSFFTQLITCLHLHLVWWSKQLYIMLIIFIVLATLNVHIHIHSFLGLIVVFHFHLFTTYFIAIFDMSGVSIGVQVVVCVWIVLQRDAVQIHFVLDGMDRTAVVESALLLALALWLAAVRIGVVWVLCTLEHAFVLEVDVVDVDVVAGVHAALARLGDHELLLRFIEHLHA